MRCRQNCVPVMNEGGQLWRKTPRGVLIIVCIWSLIDGLFAVSVGGLLVCIHWMMTEGVHVIFVLPLSVRVPRGPHCDRQRVHLRTFVWPSVFVLFDRNGIKCLDTTSVIRAEIWVPVLLTEFDSIMPFSSTLGLITRSQQYGAGKFVGKFFSSQVKKKQQRMLNVEAVPDQPYHAIFGFVLKEDNCHYFDSVKP